MCGGAVTFQVYDIDNDGFISNGELFQVLKMMVGSNLTDAQLQNIGTQASLPQLGRWSRV